MSSGMSSMSRRRAMAGLAVSSVVLAAPRLLLAQGATGAPACVLTPQSSEGPFYFDPKLERSDITEGRPGLPLRLRLQVVEAANCAPISGARVDVWHSDALGIYSGYDRPTAARASRETFLRGTQLTDGRGQTAFSTIYPGWYPGRTPHIHLKVFLADRSVLIGQMYFPDEVSDRIYRTVAAYQGRSGRRDTTNASDGLLRRSGDQGSFAQIKQDGDVYVASMVVGVDRSGRRVR